MELSNVGQARPVYLQVGSLVRVAFEFLTVAGAAPVGTCVLHFTITKVPNETGLQTFMNELATLLKADSGWKAGLGKITPITIMLDHLQGFLLKIDTTTGRVTSVDEAAAVLSLKGALTNLTGVPRQCAALVRVLSNRVGRQYRGRNFWPGIAKDDHTAGALDDNAKEALLKWGSTLLAVGNEAGTLTATLAVFSRKGQVIPPGVTRIPFATPATRVIVDGTLRTQRRRVS